MPDIAIRPATPADVQRMVPLIHSSGPAAFDSIFHGPSGMNSQQFLSYCFVQRGGMFSYEHHLVGEFRGEVIGSLVRYTHASHNATFLPTARQVIFKLGFGAAWRGMRFEHSLVKPPRKGCYYLGHIGVAPPWRGRGVGSQLIAYARTEAQRVGLPRLSLDVSAENPAAERLYERLGFVVIAEHKSYSPLLADHRYMECTLDANKTAPKPVLQPKPIPSE